MSGAPGPLAGRSIVILRSEERGAELRARLEELGASAAAVPVTRQEAAWTEEAVREALSRRAEHGWIAFTSANAVRFLDAALEGLGAPRDAWRHARVAAVGEATAAAAAQVGYRPDLVAAGSGTVLAAALAALAAQDRGDTRRRVLLPQSRIARAETRAALESGGFTVEALVVYDTVPCAAGELERLVSSWRQGGLPDALVLASPSALAALGDEGRRLLASPRLRLVAIGATTAGALRQAGLTPAATAAAPTPEGLAAAVLEALSSSSPGTASPPRP